MSTIELLGAPMFLGVDHEKRQRALVIDLLLASPNTGGPPSHLGGRDYSEFWPGLLVILLINVILRMRMPRNGI